MEQTYFSLILIIIHGNILSLQSGRRRLFQAVEMTMFSTDQFHGYKSSYDQTCIGADRESLMAEDESRTESLNGVSESTQDEKDEGWLQLSIGGQVGITRNEENNRRDGPGLVELELLPGSSGSRNEAQTCGPIHEFPSPRQFANFPTTGSGLSFFQQQVDVPRNSSNTNFLPHQEINNWTFRPTVPISTTTPYLSSYPSTLMASGSYYSRPPFQIYSGMDLRPAPVLPRPGLDFRVIPPPRRPHSGIWFMLQALKNQERELSLPQISKSYLRIKDGKMTIRLVIKYLVNKLSLENESEIEITCKGQRVEPLLTLQHVRDNIWSSSLNRDTYVTLLPNSSTVDHIMVLHYARISTPPSN